MPDSLTTWPETSMRPAWAIWAELGAGGPQTMSPQVGTVVAQYGPGLGQVMGKASLPDTLATSM